ncbi:hypothetical protein EDD96_4545 [Streptomyces sp. Ag109_G2-6]|uniref:hypothetical protein n=1 Tax=Streptomyces TaxID=1883 RepID=UPI000F511A1F|nr:MULTISPECIES: hypothetical protein [Streptomyces]RPF40768.1 hypothetical protein EDD96_4545 [Streptomyces sp. Ag109_G2-6]
MRHVHIGADALGLGLLVRLTGGDSNLDVVVAESSHDHPEAVQALREHSGYHWSVASSSTMPNAWQQLWTVVDETVDIDGNLDQLGQLISDSQTVLLSMTMPDEGWSHRVGVLAPLLEERSTSSGSEIAVIVCGGTDRNILQLGQDLSLHPNISFPAVVADRECSTPYIGTGGKVAIEVEDYYLLAVQDAERITKARQSLESLQHVIFTEYVSTLSLLKQRLFDAPVFIAVLFAICDGQGRLDDYVRSGDGESLLEKALEECLIAFRREADSVALGQLGLDESRLRDYSQQTIRRVLDFPREVSDVVQLGAEHSVRKVARLAQQTLLPPCEAYRKATGKNGEILSIATRAAVRVINAAFNYS